MNKSILSVTGAVLFIISLVVTIRVLGNKKDNELAMVKESLMSKDVTTDLRCDFYADGRFGVRDTGFVMKDGNKIALSIVSWSKLIEFSPDKPITQSSYLEFKDIPLKLYYLKDLECVFNPFRNDQKNISEKNVRTRYFSRAMCLSGSKEIIKSLL